MKLHPFLKGRYIIRSTGPEDATIAYVGEQPGVTEVRENRPFAGPAGEELTRDCKMAGTARTEVYITNVIKDLSHPLKYYINIPPKATQGVVISEEGKGYIEALAFELEQVRPNVVVCIGAAATFALTSRRGIYKWRGSVLESTLIPNLKCIPTLHPATVIPPKNVFLNRYLIASDLKRAKAESYTPAIRYETRVKMIEPNFYESKQFLLDCIDRGRGGRIIDIDIEVVNEELSCISFSYDPYKGISIPFYGPNGDYFTIDQEAEIMLLIAQIYEDPLIIVSGQNHIFDLTYNLGKYGIRLRGEVHDTMIAQKITYPDFKADLGSITTMHTDIPYYKDEGKKWMKVGGPWKQFWEYSALDSIATAAARPRQLEDLVTQDNMETYDRQRKIIQPLLYMQQRGIKVDVQGMSEERNKTEKVIEETAKKLNQVVGFSLNYNSPKQVGAYFYGQLGIKPYKDRKTGKSTCNEDALKRIAKGTATRKAYPEAKIILDLRGLAKRGSTYLDIGKVDRDGRYRSSYNPVGAKTGRLSSSKTIFGTGGNQQNWPHDLLRFLSFDSGYVGYSIDLSQVENRIVAYVGRIIEMIEAFETGKDVHRLTASLMLGKPYNEISDEDGSSSIGNGRQSERYWGKKTNHELNYDMGYKSFALEYEILEGEAKWLHSQYHSCYPGVRGNYHAEIRSSLFTNRTLTNLMGRKRIFLGDLEGQTSNKTFKEAYAQVPQSTCADIINERGLNYIYYNQDLFAPVELLTQVHDSIVFQIPKSTPLIEHARILRLIKNSLETPLVYHERSFVVPADIAVGKNLCKEEQTEIKAKDFPSTDEELAKRLEEIACPTT